MFVWCLVASKKNLKKRLTDAEQRLWDIEGLAFEAQVPGLGDGRVQATFILRITEDYNFTTNPSAFFRSGVSWINE